MSQLLIAVLALCGVTAAHAQDMKGARALPLTGDYWGTHDPSIMKDGNTWYVFATGKAPEGGQMEIRCSHDLMAWKMCGQVLPGIPAWVRGIDPKTTELWAPDISYFNGLYHLYYAFSSFGSNASGIALLTNKTLDSASPDYKWQDDGLVLRSHTSNDYNAIDPNLVMDRQGRAWLAFGSFWSGIKMRRIDPQTGKPLPEDAKLYSLAARVKPADAAPAKPGLPPDWEAVEAPFIIQHDGYYYLFVSWDLCCRGVNSTYRVMVGRSRDVTGPYLDKAGKSMLEGGGTQVLWPDGRWLGPGGESLYSEGKEALMVFHAYDAKTGKPALRISRVGWKDGWPVIATEP